MNYKPVDDAIKVLGEHYEVVVILVTNHEGDQTEYAARGCGNFFAREGMCQNYLNDQADEKLAWRINTDKGDDGEDWKENK